jgi:hypothetical protein
MQIEYIDGLLMTSMTITHNGISKTIENVVIDTGSITTFVSTPSSWVGHCSTSFTNEGNG